MAYFVKTPPLERIFKLLNPEVTSGSSGEQVYSLPIYLRKDGVVVKLGYLVKKIGSEVLHTVREILMRADLTRVTVALSPVECEKGGGAKMREELVLVDVEDVSPIKGRMMAMELARDGMRKVAQSIALYPIHVQRVVRKHQLATLIRTSVQTFLAGFSLARSTSLGCVDWRLDPGLLGLERETDFSLDYRVERFTGGVTSHLDLFLGKGWDVRKVSGGAGFRVIMTLELVVDINQQLKLDTHATLCPGNLDSNYRTRCMETLASSVTPGHSFTIFSTDNTLEQRFGRPNEAIDTSEKFPSLQSQNQPGVSLDWEEFQDSRDETTMEVSTMSTIIDKEEKDAHLVDANAGHDTTDWDIIDEASTGKELDDSTTSIHKLLDTPTKGFSQLVFNVSNKDSGESNDNKSVDTNSGKPSENLINEIVGKTREVRLSEDSLDISFDVEKDVENKNDNLSPIKLAFQDAIALKFDDSSLDISDEQVNHYRQNTSTPEGDIDEKLSLKSGLNEDKFSQNEDDLNSINNANYNKNNYIKDNETSTSSMKRADDTLENISDLTDDKLVDNNDALTLVKPKPFLTSFPLVVSNNPLNTKDVLIKSPEEDVCSEDYRVSSSYDVKKNGSQDNEGESNMKNFQSRENVEFSPTSGSLMSKSQSSVNKVAAYVQSLPSPQSGMSLLNIPYTETIKESNNEVVDDNINEDDANNSLASSRSKASRHSDLSSLNGRFSNGLFYGSAISSALGAGNTSGQTTCPFPDDWQFNTIPESIENDDELD